MKALMISGSRNPQGQTAQAAQAVMSGLAEAGDQCSSVYLPAMNIQCCRQCNDDGWGICRTEKRCVIDDDFAGVVEQMASADVIVFATPVYMGEPAETVKSFADRLRRIVSCQKAGNPLAGKCAMSVSVAGGGGGARPKRPGCWTACCTPSAWTCRTACPSAARTWR